MKNMNKAMAGWAVGLASLLVGGAAWAQGAASPGAAPGNGSPSKGMQAPAAVEEELVTIPVTVEEIDKKNRKLVLKTPDGERTMVNVPSDVKELDKLKKGDRIDIDYYQALAVAVLPEGATPSQTQTRSAGQGAAGRMGARQINASAEVTAIDRGKNTIQIKGPDGKAHSVSVRDPDVQKKMQSLKPGDVVQLTYTEAVAAKIRPRK